MPAPRPYTLIAELTYRCPLRCVYCSNPLELDRRRDELATEDWVRVLHQAEDLGVMQASFTGGEPLLRKDLEALVAAAHSLKLYTNLITSAVPLSRERLADLQKAGLDNVQISIQGVDPETSERIAGLRCDERKLEAAGWVKELGLPLSINVVLHRQNLGSLPRIIELAETLAADRLELASTQYLGWALLNRDQLLPTEEQARAARVVADEARQRLSGRMEVQFVGTDYYNEYPKPCMDGWARRFVLVAPDGLALPCHGAASLPGFMKANVRDHGLRWIWEESPLFNAFRGEAWMPEPCRGCDRRNVDFGGCRCQAFELLGDASATDPVCRLSPAHEVIVSARNHSAGGAGDLRYRTMKT